MAVLDKDGVIHFWNKIKAKLDGKANASHNHSIGEITDLKGTLDGKANISHSHDGRYYTESEVDSKLNGYTKNPTYQTFSMEYKGANYRDVTKTFTLPSMNVNDNVMYTLTGKTYVLSSESGFGGTSEVNVSLLLPSGGTYAINNNIVTTDVSHSDFRTEVSITPNSGILSGGGTVYNAHLIDVPDLTYESDIGFHFSGSVTVRRIS